MAKKPDIEHQHDGDTHEVGPSHSDLIAQAEMGQRELAEAHNAAWFDSDLTANNLATLSENSMSAEERIADLVQQVGSLRLSNGALLTINKALTEDRDALHFEVRTTASALGCELHQVADCARDMMRDIENYAESGAALMNEVSALASCVREACDAWTDGLAVRHGDDWAEKFPNIRRRIDELLNIALGPNPYEPSA